jgi:dipeptidyl aminopeptidase/acylaminoacyl peptidase
MKKWLPLIIILITTLPIYAQQTSPLTVEKIMQDPKWIGTSPDGVYWGADNKSVFFKWNPEKALADSLYFAAIKDAVPHKTNAADRALFQAQAEGTYNNSKTALTYSLHGDIYLLDIKTGKTTRITHTTPAKSNPLFLKGDTQLVYEQEDDLFMWDKTSGIISQLTNFQKGNKPVDNPPVQNEQEKWLTAQQLELLQTIKDKKEKSEVAKAFNKAHEQPSLRALYTQDKKAIKVIISPDGRFISYSLYKAPANVSNTIVPDYVTKSGFTTDIPSRQKVGAPQGTFESFIYDRKLDTVIPVNTTSLPGIKDAPDYVKDYPGKDTATKNVDREVILNGLYWSPEGTRAIVDIRSLDNKDRWLMLLNANNGQLQLLDRQRDEAWIGGPGIGWSLGGGNLGWINESTCWYQSEASGYSHLYKMEIPTGIKTALTAGQYEVQDVQLSQDKKYFYIITNEVHPGQKQLYRLSVNGGKQERLTQMAGAHEVSLSPDEKWIAFRYSSSNKPWELYLQRNEAGAKPVQVTSKAMSEEFRSYNWRIPEIITITARDNAPVYARLYTPSADKKNGAAVIFVHGAGYLQNAHMWWSLYFREYMFHNLLTDQGYTVLDLDYRGSAGYGRNWRTGIYRYMGGKDLDDQVDGAKYLSDKMGIDAKRIGIYGGSYGGFITLMALFTTPDVFAAGAALRSVTDWAHYNHGYTSSILNEPYTDSIAYRRSSPIYFANGLKSRLLMCHGMVDTNVHFEDIVRLTQRLIELGKNNWELAVFPVEDHGFTTPSSWTDEYKRIKKLFDEELLK